MRFRQICAAVLLLLLCMTLPVYATGSTEPPPHKEPPPLTEAPSQQDVPAIAPPPHKEPPPDAPPPPGDYNPIIDLCLDSKGGTFRNHLGMDLYDASMPATPGTTLASTGYRIDRITCVGKTFQGWIAYNAVTGAALSGLLTTEEVLNYTIPNHNIRFEIQWQAKDTAPADAIVYAAILNGTGQPDPNTKVTLVNNGVRYSGYGSVTIPKDIYSKWKGNVKVIWECPGEFIRANSRWIPDYFEAEDTAASFRKEGSCYNSISTTGKGKEVVSPRDVVNDYFYSVQKVQPEISREYDAPVSIYDPISSAPAPKLQVTTLQMRRHPPQIRLRTPMYSSLPRRSPRLHRKYLLSLLLLQNRRKPHPCRPGSSPQQRP